MYLKGIAIASHPPVIIPEIGGGRELKAEKTIRGIRDLAMKTAEIRPDTIVLITPHGNVFQDGVSVVYETRIQGDFGDFGASDIAIEKECDMGLLDEMNRRFAENDCESIFLNARTAEEYDIKRELDYASLVPLYYLDHYYPDYKVVHITIGHLSLIELFRIGRVLREAIEVNGKDTMILASADLSHALMDDGPYQFDPAGPIFDEKMITSLQNKDYYSILTMSPAIYDPAAQCGLRPIVMALGATDSIKTQSKVFSYEGPYGVGYLTALITFDLDQEDPTQESLISRFERDMVKAHDVRMQNEDVWTALARATVDTWAETGRQIDYEHWKAEQGDTEGIAQMEREQAGVFVSLYKGGELRGCMGTAAPVTACVAREIIRNAIEACAYDPRFLPVEVQELYQLEISVDVLGSPETVESLDDLDPAVYGIIVEKDMRRALLLPGLAGIITPEKQLEVAKEKAGIFEADDEGSPLIVQRFKVERHMAKSE